MMISMEFSGKVGFTQPTTACPQSTSTNASSYRNESPIMDTNAMIQRSVLLYVLLNSMARHTMVTITAPALIGIPNNIRRAMAPPSISAREVDMLASMADPRIGRLSTRGMYLLVASERQRPVTMPRWATLCWIMISMTDEKVTTHRRA